MTQQQPAPVERPAPQAVLNPAVHGSMVVPDQASQPGRMPDQTANTVDGSARRPQVKKMQPAQGVWVRLAQNASIQTVSSEPGRTELRLESGLVNIDVRHPAKDSQILVDMSDGGQVALLKDGVYTFNADTRTASVFRGEARAFQGDEGHGVKVKEDHQVNFALATDGGLKATELDPHNAGADLLPRNYAPGYGDGNYVAVGYYPYGYYGYPYGWGYPWGWGYPYPYLGVGFGYYGGYRGFYRGGFYRGGFGGYRGGFAGGFHGGRR